MKFETQLILQMQFSDQSILWFDNRVNYQKIYQLQKYIVPRILPQLTPSKFISLQSLNT